MTSSENSWVNILAWLCVPLALMMLGDVQATSMHESPKVVRSVSGSGHDTIIDVSGGAPGKDGKPCDNGGTFEFQGVSLGSVRLSHAENALIIQFSETDSVTIMGFDPQNAHCGGGTYNFTDVSLTYQQLIDRGFDLQGTQNDDTIHGTSAVDRMYGDAGNDTLIGYAGNDVLRGGPGSDTLDGGPDDDTYVYNIGDGVDGVTDNGGNDSVRFGVGIAVEDLTVQRTLDGGNRVARLRLLDASKREYSDQGLDLRLNRDGTSPIERFIFEGGVEMTWEQLLMRLSSPKR